MRLRWWQWRRARDVEQRAWREARERDEQWHTGTWLSPSPDLVPVQVRWDPVIDRFFFRAGFESGWEWVHRDWARSLIGDMAREGWECDRGAEEIKERLGL